MWKYGLFLALTLKRIKPSEASVSLGVGVIGVKQKSEAAARGGEQQWVHRLLKLLIVSFPTQKSYQVPFGWDLGVNTTGKIYLSTDSHQFDAVADEGIIKPDLHSIIFTVLAVLQVQVDQSDGDGLTFGRALGPV